MVWAETLSVASFAWFDPVKQRCPFCLAAAVSACPFGVGSFSFALFAFGTFLCSAFYRTFGLPDFTSSFCRFAPLSFALPCHGSGLHQCPYLVPGISNFFQRLVHGPVFFVNHCEDLCPDLLVGFHGFLEVGGLKFAEYCFV